MLKPQEAGDLTIPQPLKLAEPTTEFRAHVLETHEFLDVKLDATGNLVINLPKELAGINHPVIRVGPATSISALYEDGTAIESINPGVRGK